MSSPPVVEQAPAKLNLSLEVVARRPDGYHEIVTVFQTIDLCDRLALAPAPSTTLDVDDPTLAGDDNLVLRAVRRLGVAPGTRMHLEKRIPVAAGLGGGSSDAAAALRGLRRVHGLWHSDRELADAARDLGADVPFLLRGGTALAGGVGEELQLLPHLNAWAVLLTPPDRIEEKTTRAFAALPRDAWSDGSATRELVAALSGGGLAALAEAPNAFEAVAPRLYPSLDRARATMLAAGAAWARLTGAGPTIFTLIEGEAEAKRIADRCGGMAVATLPALR